MTNDRSVLERQIERIELRLFTLDGFHRRRHRQERNRRIGNAVVALLVAGVAIGGLLRALSSGAISGGSPRNPFLGTWVSTDADGSNQTMTIGPSGDRAVEIEAHDDSATVCSGAPSTMTGPGQVQSETELVVPSPAFVCDDGSQPEAPSGPPLEEQLRHLTFVRDPETDALTDNFGLVWERPRAEDPSSLENPIADLDPVWPQSSLEEVREAQKLADAGDPRYTWQVDPELRSGFGQPSDDTEIVARFLREELGWEAFRSMPIPEDSFGTGASYNNAYIRCAPGRTNPLYPNDPEGCAPTIDEVRYERVSIDLGQLVRQDPTGIWVVTRWAMIEPFEQVAPPSDAQSTAVLKAFLRARIEGRGAEEYIDVPHGRPDWAGSLPTSEVPLLYATTTGASYERSEFELVVGPEWPDGWTQFKVRLFAENGKTVVEQLFSLGRDGTGRLGFGYASETVGPAGHAPGTTENGQLVPLEYGFLDGELTFRAAYPWEPDPQSVGSPTMTTLLGDDRSDARVLVQADPRPIGTDCHEGPAPTDAEALARSIWSDPDLEATAPVAVRVGGTPAVRMDVVTATGARVCPWRTPFVIGESPLLLTQTPLIQGERVRLYLLDLPRGSARILAIAIISSEARFDRALELAAPIVDSLEFHMA